MTRRKVKLAYIVNDSARKATYKKRKKGLIKKVDELSTLCGIEACAIIYSSFEPQPVVWPSPPGVQKALERLKTMPELEQSKKMVNQETFTRQMILKAKDQVMKQRKENREKEMNLHMYRCINAGKVQLNMNMNDRNDLAWVIDQNLKEVDRALEKMNKTVIHQGQSSVLVGESSIQPQMALAPALAVAKTEEMTMVNDVHELVTDNSDAMQRQWYMNLINDNYGNETVPLFGDVNLQNGLFWPHP
ncbi:agamous-like MADS-box protein AGL80 [Lotus japonicus]|uniref:agamous-like MADS-box protein AGL80 n=1 Tax=Lotus japonicus TaxID=34305 RepID=UPI0025907F1B|nr:agamous-like MADS-box protein AGL80 [Lotus japonicus]